MSYIKNLVEDFAYSREEKKNINNKLFENLIDNYYKDLKSYGEATKEVYALMLGESGKELVESFDECATELLTEGEAEGRMLAYKLKSAMDAKAKPIKPTGNAFTDWAGRNIGKKPEVSKKSGGFTEWAGRNLPKEEKTGILSTVWKKIKSLGENLPAPLKAFAKQGLDFFTTNPWGKVIGAAAAAGISIAILKKIFKKKGKEVTPAMEAEYKAKLAAVPAKA